MQGARESQVSHGYKMWKTFDAPERVDILFSRARREEIELHKEEVRQNREIFRSCSLPGQAGTSI